MLRYQLKLMMRSPAAVLLLGLILAAASPLPAQTTPTAAPAPTEAEPAGIPRAPVIVNGKEVIEVSGETAEDAARRAETITRRLERLIEREEEVEKFSARDVITQDGQPLITLGHEPIVTITPADVERTLVPAQDLAQLWGGQLSNAVRAQRISRSGTVNSALYVLLSSTYDLVMSILQWLPRLLGVLLLALLFWPLARLARWVARKATKTTRVDPNLTQLAITISFYGVWGLGLLAMLTAVGVNSAGIAAAVGASGFILGFAFQDVLSHFLAGILLLMSRQFYIGGQIRVGEHEGTVEGIDLRALYLRTYDNRQVTIPNGQVFNSAVVINTSNPYRRREFTIGIGYEADARRAMELAVSIMKSVDGVLHDPTPQALISQLNPSSVQLRMYFYTSATADWLPMLSDCILLIKEAYEEAGISIPYSTHTIDVRHVGDLPEALKPLLLQLEAGHANDAPAPQPAPAAGPGADGASR